MISLVHTAGPWRATIYGGWDAPRIWSDSGSIAILQHHESGPKEAESNAIVMAAAPELLRSLKRLLATEKVLAKLPDAVLLECVNDTGAEPEAREIAAAFLHARETIAKIEASL